MPVKRCRLLSEMLSLKQHLDFRSLLASRTICSHSSSQPHWFVAAGGCPRALGGAWPLSPLSPAQDSAWLQPSRAACSAPWAELTALAYPSEDFAAEYDVASKAVGRSPWNLLFPSAFGGSEFANENKQTAPQTMGHRTPPVPQPCSGSGANASFWKGHFSPAPGTLQIKSINPGWEHRGHSVQ